MLQRWLFNNKKSTEQDKPKVEDSPATQESGAYRDQIVRLSYFHGYSVQSLGEVERTYNEMHQCVNSKFILKSQRCSREISRFDDSHDRYTGSRILTQAYHDFVFNHSSTTHPSDEVASLQMSYARCNKEVSILSKLSILAQQDSFVPENQQKINSAAIMNEFDKCKKIMVEIEEKSRAMKIK